jgi:hypothetical protein
VQETIEVRWISEIVVDDSFKRVKESELISREAYDENSNIY